MSDLFESINNLFTKKDKDLEITDVYMTNRFLSMHSLSFFQAFFANTIASKLSKEDINDLLKIIIPQQKFAPRIYYIKEQKRNLSNKDKWKIKLISKIFHCSKFHSEQITRILESQNISIDSILGEKK